jgi:dipeptidyl aminopeptidase/acylaminoacyl peptidase
MSHSRRSLPLTAARAAHLAVPVLLASACRAPSTPARVEPLDAEHVRALLEVRAPTTPVLAPDGALYVRDWPDGVNQIYRRDAGGTSARLSSFTDGASGFSLAPDGSRALVRANAGGNEEDQLYVVGGTRPGSESSVIEPLLERAHTVFRPHHWLANSSGFFYSANDASADDFHLYRFDFEAPGSARGTSTRVLAERGSWSVEDATDDGTRLLVARSVSASESHLFELDVRTGARRELGPAPEKGESFSNGAIGYLQGERALLVDSDAGDGRRRLWRQDLDTGQLAHALPALDAFELEDAKLDLTRSLLAVVTNEDGYGTLHVFRLPAGEEVELPPIERGVVGLTEFTGRTLVFVLSSARSPGLAFALDVPATGAARVRPLTTATAKGVDLTRLVEPELVHYRSFDGLEIPAFLYAPKGVAPGERAPWVVHFHGGPEGQHRPAFDRVAQALVASGFGVLQPNVRGSTGYGRAYHRLDDGKKRWDSVRDGAEAARWLVATGRAEAGHIAAYGGSYGGFMSVATVIEGADVFGAAIDVVGIVNFETFLEQTAGYRRALREAEYGSLADKDFLRSISPLARAQEIRCPMLIAHGLNDPRVPVGEALQLAVTLQTRGADPELYVFPDEGHGFQKLENRVLFTTRMVRFLARTIGAPR